MTASVFARLHDDGHEPSSLYRMLGNAPKLLRAYAALARALRYEAETPRALRELVILNVARLTGSEYATAHHRHMAAAAGVPLRHVQELGHWATSDAFDAPERAALRCAEEMHDLALSDEAFAELRTSFTESEAVELILLVAFYEAVVRLIQALGPEVEPPYLLPPDEQPNPRG